MTCLLIYTDMILTNTYLGECHQETEDHGDEADDDHGEEVVAVVLTDPPGGGGQLVLDAGAVREVGVRAGLPAARLAGGEIHEAV